MSTFPGLNPDRFFDPEPSVRRIARELYEETCDLPLICPHGHVDPALLADDRPFPEPATLIVVPDQYIIRMLYSQGVPMEALGIASRDGASVERDPRKIWRVFASFYYLFRGTPTGAWIDHELSEVFGVRTRLTGETAQVVYDEIGEKLRSPEFRPRALFERFRIEVLATSAPERRLGKRDLLGSDCLAANVAKELIREWSSQRGVCGRAVGCVVEKPGVVRQEKERRFRSLEPFANGAFG